MAPRLSVMWTGSAVPGMTAVTRASLNRYFRKNCAQVSAKERAQSGTSLPRTARKSRGRQHALFGFAVVERIVDLHEIRLLAQQHRLDGAEVAVPRGGDADIAAHT